MRDLHKVAVLKRRLAAAGETGEAMKRADEAEGAAGLCKVECGEWRARAGAAEAELARLGGGLDGAKDQIEELIRFHRER